MLQPMGSQRVGHNLATEQQQKRDPGSPWWFGGEESAYQHVRYGFDPWVGKIPWRRKCIFPEYFPPLYSYLGKSSGQRRLVGYSPWGCEGSDTTEQLNKRDPRRLAWSSYLACTQWEVGCLWTRTSHTLSLNLLEPRSQAAHPAELCEINFSCLQVTQSSAFVIVDQMD